MNAEQKSIVISETIKGVPSRTIANEIGTSHVAVIRARKSDDVKPILDKALSQLIKRGANPAVKTLCRAAALGNTKDAPKNIDLFKLSIQASEKILNHVSGGPQTVINQLIYSQSTHTTSDNLSIQLVNRALGIVTDDDVIDVQPE